MLRTVAVALAFDGVVLAPPSDATGPDVGLVYVHGAKCLPAAYVNGTKWLQEEVKGSMRLHVALPLFSTFVYPDAPLPFLVDGGVDAGFAELQKQANMSSKFLAGHSMGGAMVPMYKHVADLDGIMTLGAYLTRAYRGKPFPTAVLQVGAELDGGAARVMRMAEAFHSYFPNGDDAAEAQRNPVVVVPGMSHAQFLAGPAPAEVVKSDLIPEISTTQAHQQLAQVLGAFMRGKVLKQDEAVLTQWVSKTADLVAPYVEALRLEDFPYLTKMGDATPAPLGSPSPWTLQVLTKYSAPLVEAGVAVDLTNAVHGFDFEHQHPKPEMVNGQLHVNTASNNKYSLLSPKVDVQYGPLATPSLGWKYERLDALFDAANVTMPKTVAQPTCREANQQALDWARANIPAEQLARYQKYGDVIEMMDDTSVLGNIGPLWCTTGLKIGTKQGPVGDVWTVQGVAETSPTHGHLPFPGAFYCKTLSPGYALELLGMESLRRLRALSTEPTHDNNDAGPATQVQQIIV